MLDNTLTDSAATTADLDALLRMTLHERNREIADRYTALGRDLASDLMTDPLTGINNRKSILFAMEELLNDARREGKPISVIFIDLVYFKHFNDRWGHLAGDIVLQQVGHRLKTTIRPLDCCGRIGGEEFLVAIRGDESDARAVAQRIEAAFMELSIVASFGIAATGASGTWCSSEELLATADTAMYTHKAEQHKTLVPDRVTLLAFDSLRYRRLLPATVAA